MLSWLRSLAAPKSRAREYYPLDHLPDSFFPARSQQVDSPLGLSPFYAALRLFQTTVGSIPLVTYRDGGDAGRDRVTAHPAYPLLHAAPNPSMTRATFWDVLIRDLYLRGEFFIHVIRAAGQPKMLLPVPHSAVQRVRRLADWRKEYQVRTTDGLETVPHADMIHVLNFPDEDGLRGKSLEHFACEAMNLHRQVQLAGTSFFENAVRPANYVTFAGNIMPEAAQDLVRRLDERHAGAGNRGKTFYLTNGGKLEAVSDQTAEEARVVEMLSASVADVARWFGVSPLTLGDLSRGTYSNLAADNAAFYQRSARPLLDKIELAVNACLFGSASDVYAEFLTDAILRGDPAQQAEIDVKYLQAEVYTRQEVRRWKNLKDVAGLDVPTAPINTGGNPQLSGGTIGPAQDPVGSPVVPA